MLWLNLIYYIGSFDGIDKNLVCWRQLNNSLSASSFQKIKDGYTLYKKHLNFSFLLSLFCVLRLSFYAFKKKNYNVFINLNAKFDINYTCKI